MGHHHSYRCRNYRWRNLLTVPKTNDELAAADKVKNTQKKKNSERQRQSDKASTINRRIHHYRRTSAG